MYDFSATKTTYKEGNVCSPKRYSNLSLMSSIQLLTAWKFCPMGRSRSWYIRPKAHNVVAASVEGRLPITTKAVADAHGAPAIGTTTRSISLRTPLAYVAQSTASSRRRSHINTSCGAPNRPPSTKCLSVWEMTDLLALNLVAKGLMTDQTALYIGYGRKSLRGDNAIPARSEKPGGRYVTFSGNMRKPDGIKCAIIMMDCYENRRGY